MDVRTVGPDPVPHRGGAGEQSGFEHRVVQVGRQRPAEPVAAAYGWSAHISDDEVLRELLTLNGGGE